MLQEQYLEELQAGHERDSAYILPYIEKWYAEGRVTGPDPETIVDVFDAVAHLTLHIKGIGEERYSAVRDTIIAAVAVELTRTTDETDPTEDVGGVGYRCRFNPTRNPSVTRHEIYLEFPPFAFPALQVIYLYITNRITTCNHTSKII